jgi:NAD(P)H-flavin reductase
MPAEQTATMARPAWEPPRGPMTPVRYRIDDRQEGADDTCTVAISPLDSPIAEPRPGQFLMLYAFGVGEIPISVSACPAEDGTIAHTIRTVGAVSRELSRLSPGAVIGVRGPFGSMWPLDVARGHQVIAIAGGIGLAPLRPAMRHVRLHLADFGALSLLIGTRSPDRLLFRPEVEDWRSRFQVEVTVDVGDRSWRGDVGFVDRLVSRIDVHRDAVAMVCGPEVMMRLVVRELIDAGLPGNRVYVALERNMKCAVRQCGQSAQLSNVSGSPE